jgi:exoribonuclease R
VDMDTFTRLAEVMNRADARADRVEAAAIDLVEATLMRGRTGETFAAVVTGTTDSSARVQLREPAVRGVVPGGAGLAPGTVVTVRLEEADPARRTVRLALAGGGNG